MNKERFNAQDQYLNTLRKNNSEVKIVDTNNCENTGMITSFDQFCIRLTYEEQEQMFYKTNIVSIVAWKDDLK